MGDLSILNVGEGDMKITFDRANAPETIRAKRIIKDMIRRGYALLVQQEDGTYLRAKDFDDKTGEYLIADFDPNGDDEDEHAKDSETKADDAASATAEATTKRRGRRPAVRRVPIEKASGVAIARSAGG